MAQEQAALAVVGLISLFQALRMQKQRRCMVTLPLFYRVLFVQFQVNVPAAGGDFTNSAGAGVRHGAAGAAGVGDELLFGAKGAGDVAAAGLDMHCVSFTALKPDASAGGFQLHIRLCQHVLEIHASAVDFC